MITLTTAYQKIKETYLGDNGYGGSVYVRTYAKYSEQSIVNNTTTMQVQTRIYSGGTWWASSGTGHTTSANGESRSGNDLTNSWNMWQVGETTIETLETVVQHADDGTKELVVSSYFHSDPWGWAGTASDTVKLPTIPRASTLNSSTMTIASNGNSITVTSGITKNVNTYYDCLVVKDNNTTVITLDGVTNNTAKSLTSAQITTIYSSIGTATSKTFTCYLATYSDSNKTTLIGNSNSINLVATLPTYTISVTATVTDTVTTYNTYKGSGNQNKIYIANLSKPKFVLSSTSSTGSYYGRSVTYKSGDIAITSPYTDNSYTGQSYTITATDGRKTATATISPAMTHIPYFRPTLTTTVSRPNATGDTVTVSISGSYYDGNGLTSLATATATLVYTESGGSQQSTTISLTASTSNHKTTFTGTKTLSGMNYQKSVQWSVTLSDRITVTAVNSGTLTQGLPVWSAYRKNDINYFKINGQVDKDLTLKQDSKIYWKEDGYGDKFAILPTFGGADDNNKLQIQGAVGGAGTDPNLYNLVTVSGKNGDVWLKGSLSIGSMERNTNDTWVPVISQGKIAYTTRYMPNTKTHSQHNTEQDRLATLNMLSFWNGAYNSNNSSNLTYAHQGEIQCKPTSLYDNSSGTTGTVTLSQTAANFNYLEIYYYRHSDKQTMCQKIYSPNNKNVQLISAWYGNDSGTINFYIYREKIAISGTSITISEKGAGWFNGSGQGVWEMDGMYICKVVGYK